MAAAHSAYQRPGTNPSHDVVQPGYLLIHKYPGLRYRASRENGMLVERDVAVPMRDGVKLYADVHRPDNGERVPAIVAWSPYGKHRPFQHEYFYKNADVRLECWLEKRRGERSRGEVGRPARREGHDDGDRLRRIALRAGRRGGEREGERCDPVRDVHGCSSMRHAVQHVLIVPGEKAAHVLHDDGQRARRVLVE